MAATRLEPLILGGAAAVCALAARESELVRHAVQAEGGHDAPLFSTHVALLAPAAALAVGGLLVTRMLLGGGARAEAGAAHRRRALLAAGGPLAIFGALAWMVAAAHAARAVLASGGEPLAVGGALAAISLLVLGAIAAASLALLPTLVRALTPADDGARTRVLPWRTTAIAALLALAVLTAGVATGEPSGARGTLGVFGVLRRTELDLRPIAHALVLFAATWGLAAGADRLLRRARRALLASRAAGLLVVVAGAALLGLAANDLERRPDLAATIRREAPLAGVALAALQRAADRDGDGYSRWFGGGDCDDRDARRNPGALDVPGNGVDEDCSGQDTPAPAPEEPRAVSGSRLTRSYNVLLITIDALRFDLGFMGHPRPITPSLDALAARATVFENAYAMASMTWQSLGSLMVGKYPSEIGGYERFNHFLPENVVVTERLREAGVRAFAGMCQFAFSKPRPMDVPRASYAHVGHGFEVWDTSADPDPNGFDYEDDASTSDKLTDAAIALMRQPENVRPPGGRFFAWFHYFDPHTQYVTHPEAPDFSTGDKSEIGRDRARYESELWFADHHIGRLLDFIAGEPWGKDTAIIVTGDHGEAFGEHNMRWHRKELWEELIHVPLLVYVPGQAPRRVAIRRSHIDLARTLLELTGTPAPEDGSVRGESLVDDVLAPDGYVAREREVYAEIVPSENPVRRAFISGPGRGMKLVHRGGTAYELYDLDADPGEKTNLAGRRATLAPVLERFQRFRGGLREVPFPPPTQPR
ncbi:MAG: sulfatase-like hydrolase/transferase [Labilithrix sp.]|nr:sulfatase-like hydrolase/transferase [Labilithrix sp.]